MASNDDFTVTVEESAGGIEPGDTVTATIDHLAREERQSSDGDDILYCVIHVEEENVGMPFQLWLSMGEKGAPRITPNTLLGQVYQRLGGSLEVGEEVDLTGVFSPGTQVDFEVEEGDEKDDGSHFLNAKRASVRLAGEPAPEDVQAGGSSDSDDSEAEATPDTSDVDDDIATDVLDIVAEMEGESEADVKKAILSEGNEHFGAFKTLVDDGTLEVVDDGVFLAE